ncbi:phosphoglycerate mutase-like protein [Lentinula aciculospora]|uniref:Phosphoglycerate mutase-like protein n=1 Tax=Lentinula aciculospora TaxID=153920 RepID=A0A9W9DUX9_9AGAR|nr:phosphoglycerate mutase-like protein [Lentinula aciculospora]KAJ4487609.1 phosphoglycerate mutase-like protein [Lentinula aciculospora]
MLMARIYILRHGETDENRAHIIQGQRDTLLNEAGRKQAAIAIDVFQNVDLDIALTSDLKRAAETAEIIIQDHPKRDKITLIKDERLRERFLGKLEGKHLSERRNQSGVDDTAESVASFLDRALSWWDMEIIKRLAGAGGNRPQEVLVVSHGGFISSLVKNLISSGRVEAKPEQVTNWTCFNLSITTIDMKEGSKPLLVSYSNISHLKAEELVQYNADVLKAAGFN